MDGPSSPESDAGMLRSLPSVDHLLRQPALASLAEGYPHGEVKRAIRDVLEQRRAALRAGQPADIDTPALALAVRQRLYERSRPHLRKVINATGIVLHTGLGRAPLAEEAIDALVEVAGGYCNLELDLVSGKRGDRHEHVRELLRELCDAEDALVVNNNAAATLLSLAALAASREVVVSRGQLVEIGGSYRLPEIMLAAGCRLVEVGTTNRTRIADYARAITSETALLLRVHTSNYRIVGFSESVGVGELAELARERDLLVVDDLGSGLLLPELAPQALPPRDERGPADSDRDEPAPRPTSPHEPTAPDAFQTHTAMWDEPIVRASLAAGADVVLFSGDKLLGGPQAGIIVGDHEPLRRMQQHPLARALRPDKLTFAALEATLRLYRDPATLTRHVPVHRMLRRSFGELDAAALRLADAIRTALPEADVQVADGVSEAGGGALPALPLPTRVVCLRMPGFDAQRVACELRQQDVPIVCRVRNAALCFDPRTLADEEIEQVAMGLQEVVREARST